MARVLDFPITQLRNEELLGFCREQEKKLVTVDSVKLSEVYTLFHQKVDDYSNELDCENELQYKDLTAADTVVCTIIRHFKSHLQLMRVYPDEATNAAAEEVWSAIDQYDQMPKTSFTDQYAFLSRMLDQLERLPQSLLERAQVAAWVPAFRKAYDNFMNKQDDYDNAKAELPAGRIKAARQIVIEAWRDLSEFINSMSVLQPSPELERMVNQMNARIERAKRSLKQHRLNKNDDDNSESKPSGDSVVAPIAVVEKLEEKSEETVKAGGSAGDGL